MHWGYNWQSGWFLGMHLLWWTFWIAILGICMWALTRAGGASHPRAPETPLGILERRYAEGAITTVEYEERRARLAESA